MNEWQPIETAPKDFVTAFDGWNGERITDITWGTSSWSKENCFCVIETDSYGCTWAKVTGLTHWMPLPNPPSDV
jgi:hypothetical protein